MSDPGPYLNESGDYWYPVDEWSWNKARQHVAHMVRYDCGDWVRTRYLGKAMAGLHDHEDYEGCEDEGCQRMAYHFESYE